MFIAIEGTDMDECIAIVGEFVRVLISITHDVVTLYPTDYFVSKFGEKRDEHSKMLLALLDYREFQNQVDCHNPPVYQSLVTIYYYSFLSPCSYRVRTDAKRIPDHVFFLDNGQNEQKKNMFKEFATHANLMYTVLHVTEENRVAIPYEILCRCADLLPDLDAVTPVMQADV